MFPYDLLTMDKETTVTYSLVVYQYTAVLVSLFSHFSYNVVYDFEI